MSLAVNTHAWGTRARALRPRMRGVASKSSRTTRRAAGEPVLNTRDLFVLGWVCTHLRLCSTPRQQASCSAYRRHGYSHRLARAAFHTTASDTTCASTPTTCGNG